MYIRRFLLLCIWFSLPIKAQTVWGENNSRTEFLHDAGLQGDAGAVSGFFQTYSPVNYPAHASGWWHLLDVRHSNPSNNYAMQLAGSFFDQQLYFRKTNASPTTPWSRVLLEDSNGAINLGKLYLQTTSGQSFFTGHQVGSGYTYGQGIFRAVSDNPAGASNYYYEGVTNGSVNFNVRADGQGYFSGNLGIGTTTPIEKLSVNGKIRAKEIKVELSGWPDYVFTKEHKLPQLKDIESFIKKNQHLPEIPSAQEVEENGLSLGEINAKLLKKIEELTLYLIEQNKKIETLQQDVMQLKKTN